MVAFLSVTASMMIDSKGGIKGYRMIECFWADTKREIGEYVGIFRGKTGIDSR